MGFAVGNLTIEDLEWALGITLTDEERQAMKDSRQEVCGQIGADQWHGFELPALNILCGSMDMAIKVRDMLSPYESQMKQKLHISIDEDE